MEHYLHLTNPVPYTIRPSKNASDPWSRMEFTNENFDKNYWRCSRYEDFKSPQILYGPCGKETHSEENVKKADPLRSTLANYYKTTYMVDYDKKYAFPKRKTKCKGHFIPPVYPTHAPLQNAKIRLASFRTVYDIEYCRPRLEDLQSTHDTNIMSDCWVPGEEATRCGECTDKSIWK